PEPATDLTIVGRTPAGEAVRTPVPSIPPLGIRKVGFRIAGSLAVAGKPVPVALILIRGEKADLDTATLNLNVVPSTANHKHTFRSDIDDSVQYYGHVPAAADPKGSKPGLVLTLHGASVEAIGQSACYSPKPGLHFV